MNVKGCFDFFCHWGLNHLKILQRFHNSSFFFRRTLQLPTALRLGFVIALPLDDSQLLLDLCDIEARYLQTSMLENICLDLLVGRVPLKPGDIQPLQGEFDLYRAMWLCSLGKAHDRLISIRDV